MSAPLFHAAKKGDRISHSVDQSSRSTDAVIAAVLGQALASRGAGGALLAQVGAGASCRGSARATLSITELLPRSTTGTIEIASPTVFVAPGMGAALAEAEPVDCRNHSDKPIEPASTTVLVQGLPLARVGSQTGCGAVLCDGAPTVLLGGPASAGKGSGTTGGSPVTDAVALAGSLAAGVPAVLAAAGRGAALLRSTLTPESLEGACGGALSALTGALASVTSGAALGALAGASF